VAGNAPHGELGAERALHNCDHSKDVNLAPFGGGARCARRHDGSVAFAGSLWNLLPRMNAAIALIFSLAVWFALAALLWYVRKRHPWSPPRTRRP
jgi:hypothetical protein